MTFFNLFRKSVKTEEPKTEPLTDPIVEKSLFVAEEPPTETVCENKPSALKEFLSRDYHALAYNESYLNPSAELLDANLKKIQSEFRACLDVMIDEKRSEINEVKLHQIQTRGISKELEESLQHTIDKITNLVHELDVQKILSVEGEGWVAACVSNFRIGFIKGVEQYRRDKLMAGNTGLF